MNRERSAAAKPRGKRGGGAGKGPGAPTVQRAVAACCGARPRLGLAAALALTGAAGAMAAEPALVVGVAPFPPHVMESPQGVRGFDIDIWTAVAESIGSESTFRLMPLEQLTEAVQGGDVDVAIAGMSITSERELEMDFSHPYMESGLRILTTTDQEPAIIRVFRSITAEAELSALGALVAFFLICSNVLFFVERGSSGISRRYFPGILEAAWCVLATITTVGYGDVTPRRWTGRLVSLLVMVIGIALFGVAIAQLSAGLMLAELTSDIGGPDDLGDRPVATVAGSTSTLAALRLGARLVEVERIEEAYGLLQSGAVEAILFDAAPLMQYARQEGGTAVVLVGPLIERQSYGIAFPPGSGLRENVNRALLALRESGEYDRIYARWFASAP